MPLCRSSSACSFCGQWITFAFVRAPVSAAFAIGRLCISRCTALSSRSASTSIGLSSSFRSSTSSLEIVASAPSRSCPLRRSPHRRSSRRCRRSAWWFAFAHSMHSLVHFITSACDPSICVISSSTARTHLVAFAREMLRKRPPSRQSASSFASASASFLSRMNFASSGTTFSGALWISATSSGSVIVRVLHISARCACVKTSLFTTPASDSALSVPDKKPAARSTGTSSASASSLASRHTSMAAPLVILLFLKGVKSKQKKEAFTHTKVCFFV